MSAAEVAALAVPGLKLACVILAYGVVVASTGNLFDWWPDPGADDAESLFSLACAIGAATAVWVI